MSTFLGAKVAMDFIQNEGLAPMAVKKSKFWEPFWSYQLNSTANLAHLPRNPAEWAELAKIALLL